MSIFLMNLKRNLKGAFTTVKANFREYICFFLALILVQMLFCTTVITVNNGRELEQETYALLKNSTLNFTGNVEARNAALGEVDVVVTDGFTGNIYLKTVEGMGKFMKASLKKIFFRNLGTKIGAMFTMKGIKEISKQMDYRETGGSPLLGTAKPVLKAHGSSDALAFKNAVRQAKDFVERNVIAEMEKVLSENTEG